MVLHDISMAARFSDYVVATRDGQIVVTGSPREVIQSSTRRRVFGLAAEFVAEPMSGQPHVIPLYVDGFKGLSAVDGQEEPQTSPVHAPPTQA